MFDEILNLTLSNSTDPSASDSGSMSTFSIIAVGCLTAAVAVRAFGFFSNKKPSVEVKNPEKTETLPKSFLSSCGPDAYIDSTPSKTDTHGLFNPEEYSDYDDELVKTKEYRSVMRSI